MSCFVSEFLSSEDSINLPWAGCRHCRREDCPFVYDLALRRAACRGRAAARVLAAKADLLLETISNAGDVRCLLDADASLERALAQALRSEKVQFDELCAQTAKHST